MKEREPVRTDFPSSQGVATCAIGMLWLGLAWGCARTPAGHASPVSRLDTAPVLIGCSSYQNPPRSSASSVVLRFEVDERGAIVPGSIHAIKRRHERPRGGEALMERAMRDVVSCSFTPGLLNGEPVRTTMEMRFRYPGGA
jgi:hypothetical protein